MIEEIVKKWTQKAENDFKTGRDELLTDEPATDMVCFHMEQCIEKYLKAFLVFHSKDFRRTHNIAELIELCKEMDHEFEKLYEMNADKLTIYAVEVRYPEDFYMPALEEAKKCLEVATEVKHFVRTKLKNKGINDL